MAKPKHSAANERIKRDYFAYLREAQRRNEASIDAVAAALARFEASTGYKDFGKFHIAQAVAFKQRLALANGVRSGERLSQATLHSTLSALRAFFVWLAGQPGFKSRISYVDADYFNLSEKGVRIARATREQAVPTLEQVHHVLSAMPSATDIEKRNRALIAFTLLTGARDGAVASLKLKHVDLANGRLDQDARDVKTKFSKTFSTWFFPVGGDAQAIVTGWIAHLREALHWGDGDALFPATRIGLGPTGAFAAVGLERTVWSGAGPIRRIFREAFALAGLPPVQPHSFRKMLTQLGEQRCRTAEEFKAWSQNLGHEDVLTTFRSYGAVASSRQATIIRGLGTTALARVQDTVEARLARVEAIMAAGALGEPNGVL